MFDAFKVDKLKHLSFSGKSGLSIYPWRNCKPRKTLNIKKPLSECNVAIVSSAGLYIKNEQNNFDKNIKGGDWSYRTISINVDFNELADGHRSSTFNHSGLNKNPSIGMPIPQLIELKNDGFIKKVNHQHFSLMGSILAPGRLIKNTIPKIVKSLLDDKVDCVLLVPV